MQSSLSHDPEPNFSQTQKLAADKFIQKSRNVRKSSTSPPLLFPFSPLPLCFSVSRFDPPHKKIKNSSLDLFLSESMMEKCARPNV